MLKSRPSGCRVDRSYVSTLSKGNGTAAVPYLAAFLSQRSVMMTSFRCASLRRAAAASRSLQTLDTHKTSQRALLNGRRPTQLITCSMRKPYRTRLV